MLTLSRIKVKDLFGCLNHDVHLKAEGITFIHGPNGCGKTTVLKLLDGALACNFDALREIDFAELSLSFSDGSDITIIRQLQKQTELSETDLRFDVDDINEPPQIAFKLVESRKGKATREQEVLLEATDAEDIAAAIRRKPGIVTRYLPQLVRVGSRSWRDRDSRLPLSPRSIADKFANAFPFNFPIWYREKVKEIPRGYVPTQRLFKLAKTTVDEFDEGTTTLCEVVDLFADELKRGMAATIEKSAVNSQGKERSFPQRILADESPSKKESELRALYGDLVARLKDLSAVGLQEQASDLALPKKKLNPTMRRVLSLYLSDLNEKLDTFSELQSRIQLIKSIYGTKLRRKSFQITRADGFLITDKFSDRTINPTELSSGEQHQLVMLYQLVFSEPSRQLFLIDEPEISLHVEWQRMFLDDLLRIADLRGHSFLIATHSPQIINSRIDLAVPLDGGIAL